MKTVIELAREAGLHRQQHNLMSNPVQYRFSYEGYEENLKLFAELVRADEREALETLYTDANYIFNNPPGEASQEVRDVIEWYAAAIRARGETK